MTSELERFRRALSLQYLEPLVSKAKGEYVRAMFDDNYTGYEEHFVAKFLSDHILSYAQGNE